MVKYAACYPGQGAQKPKMALDLYDQSQAVQQLFSLASDVTGRNLHQLLETADDEALKQTEITQIAITLANRSAALVLQEQGIVPECHAGFSLGELSAYAGAQVLSDEDLFAIVAKRGALMAKASEESATRHGILGMAAIIGLGFDTVERVLSEREAKQLYCANDNGPLQVVISGLAAEIERCTEALKAAGARRVIPLRVSGPFHTPLMQEAQDEFSDFLSQFSFHDPHTPLYATVTGSRVTTGDAVRELCVRQLSSPVRWTTIMRHLVEIEQVTATIEAGPGSVLSGLWKSSGYPMTCLPAGTADDIRSIVREELSHE